MKIEMKNINLNYEGKSVLDNLSVEFTPNKINCLLGRSGAGKTSILRIISGITHPNSGEIYFDGITGQNISIAQRKIGWVPQQQILFPGLNVKQNILYGMEVRKFSKEEKNRRLEEITKIVSLGNIIDRDVAQLSGGEKQRVALARAIAPYPNLLLLDEPFSSLDASERDRLALTFRQIQMETGLTTIHVTHSPREAAIISDKAFVLSNGTILQSGMMNELFELPNSVEVARILNLPNIISSESEFGNIQAMMVPINAILLGRGPFRAKIISATTKIIYLLTNSGKQIRATNNNYDIMSGQDVNFQIDHDQVIKLS